MLSEWRNSASLQHSVSCLSWASQASQKQRRGRAGRVIQGECYHLFSKERLAEMGTAASFSLPICSRSLLMISHSMPTDPMAHQLTISETLKETWQAASLKSQTKTPSFSFLYLRWSFLKGCPFHGALHSEILARMLKGISLETAGVTEVLI